MFWSHQSLQKELKESPSEWLPRGPQLIHGSPLPGDQDAAPVIPITASRSLAVCLGGDPRASLRLGKGNILPFLDPDRHTPFCFKMLLLPAAARGGSPTSVA